MFHWITDALGFNSKAKTDEPDPLEEIKRELQELKDKQQLDHDRLEKRISLLEEKIDTITKNAEELLEIFGKYNQRTLEELQIIHIQLEKESRKVEKIIDCLEKILVPEELEQSHQENIRGLKALNSRLKNHRTRCSKRMHVLTGMKING